jgi:hypothetical protein
MSSSETSALTRATRSNIQEDGILHWELCCLAIAPETAIGTKNCKSEISAVWNPNPRVVSHANPPSVMHVHSFGPYAINGEVGAGFTTFTLDRRLLTR